MIIIIVTIPVLVIGGMYLINSFVKIRLSKIGKVGGPGQGTNRNYLLNNENNESINQSINQ